MYEITTDLKNSASPRLSGENALAEALAFYGMGELAEPVERVVIEAYVTRLTASTVECLALSPEIDPEPNKACEFLRSEVAVQYFSAERAMISIPKAYLPAFCLWRYRLTGQHLAEVKSLVARHNAPYLKSTPAKPERIGNVRI